MIDPNDKAMIVDITCGCGATLFVRYPGGWTMTAELMRLAQAWTEAHKLHKKDVVAK